MSRIPRTWRDPTTGKVYESHYEWLNEHLPSVLMKLGCDINVANAGIVSAHGDKYSGIKYEIIDAGIMYPHAVAICLMSYITPWRQEIRDYRFCCDWDQLVPWVKKKYVEIKDVLPPLEPASHW